MNYVAIAGALSFILFFALRNNPIFSEREYRNLYAIQIFICFVFAFVFPFGFWSGACLIIPFWIFLRFFLKKNSFTRR